MRFTASFEVFIEGDAEGHEFRISAPAQEKCIVEYRLEGGGTRRVVGHSPHVVIRGGQAVVRLARLRTKQTPSTYLPEVDLARIVRVLVLRRKVI